VFILKDDKLCKMFEVDLLYIPGGAIDLVDFYRGKITLRRMCLLAIGLPKDSRVHTELIRREFNGEEPWGPSEVMLAAVCDEIRFSNYLTTYGWWLKSEEGKRGPAPTPPERIKPPGFQPEEPEHEMDTTIEFGTRADWDALMALT
jgi:hypothetical protein